MLLITIRKSHTVFRLVLTSVTLNDLERRNSTYFALFHRIRQLCRPVTSQWLKIDLYCMQNIIFQFWLQLNILQRGLSAMAVLLFWFSIPYPQSACKIGGLYLRLFQRYEGVPKFKNRSCDLGNAPL